MLLERGLSGTAAQWPAVRTAFGWVHQVARILGNAAEEPAAQVRSRLRGLLGAMKRHRQAAGKLSSAVDHFLKVTGSYWPGLFHCYDAPDLPRTNNDLEQFFGRHRHHHRRATGRKAASPSLVLRGSAQLIAAAATRQHVYTARELAQSHLSAWRSLRRQLEARRERRAQRTRFRRDPVAYLRSLEEQLLQPALPP